VDVTPIAFRYSLISYGVANAITLSTGVPDLL
jgi:hypothetical protein